MLGAKYGAIMAEDLQLHGTMSCFIAKIYINEVGVFYISESRLLVALEVTDYRERAKWELTCKSATLIKY